MCCCKSHHFDSHHHIPHFHRTSSFGSQPSFHRCGCCHDHHWDDCRRVYRIKSLKGRKYQELEYKDLRKLVKKIVEELHEEKRRKKKEKKEEKKEY